MNERGREPRVRTRLRRRLGRRGAAGDAGAALVTVIMLMFVVGALSVLVLGAVVSQVRPTTATQESTQVLYAAETGLQSALSQIRSATTTSTGGEVVGSTAALPCTALTGDVGSSASGISFTASVRYFTADPTGRSAAWLDANALTCTASGPDRTPAYVLITSTGKDTSTAAVVHSRVLQAEYALKLTNANVPGGILYTARQTLCLTAASATAGATVRYTAADSCSSSNPLQQWVYDSGYHLVLASTVATTTSGGTTTTSGLCLTQPDLGAGDRTVTLRSCTLDSRTPTQLWSYEGGARFRGQNADNTDYGTNCLWAGRTTGPLHGQLLVAGGSDTCSSQDQDYGSFAPEARVGAGAASMRTSQIVNYLEFGRCMDVLFEDVHQTKMIVYPCKQDPSGLDRLFWNHRWYYGAETGQPSEPVGSASMSTRIRVQVANDPNRQYCLTTPAAGAGPAYVVFRSCDGSASQQYTRTYDTGDLATKYLFRTSDGRCLGIAPATDAGVSASTIVAATCTGGPEQKWNAEPTAQDASVSGQQELTVGGP